MWSHWAPQSRKRRKAEKQSRKPASESDLVVLGAWPDCHGPAWLKQRDRPITPPSNASTIGTQEQWKTIPQMGPFFTKFPLEIRRRIYDFALGEEMLRLEVDGAKLDLWRCNGWTREFWAENGAWKRQYDQGWRFLNYPPEEHKKGRKRKQRRAAINLLCTCRQVYLEAIGSICESQTFVLAIGPHQERVHHHYKPTLLYLPYFILSQRFNQLRRLYIHWNLSPVAVRHIGIAHETIFWWQECWHFLATLQGLNELLIKFQCRDEEHSRWDWKALEAQLGGYISRVRVMRRFVVVLPFPESAMVDIDSNVGGSRCEVRVPQKCSL